METDWLSSKLPLTQIDFEQGSENFISTLVCIGVILREFQCEIKLNINLLNIS